MEAGNKQRNGGSPTSIVTYTEESVQFVGSQNDPPNSPETPKDAIINLRRKNLPKFFVLINSGRNYNCKETSNEINYFFIVRRVYKETRPRRRDQRTGRVNNKE